MVHDRQKFTSLRNKVIKEIGIAKANSFLNIISNARCNIKEIWTHIEKLTENHAVSREIRELLLEGNVIYDSRDIATALNNVVVVTLYTQLKTWHKIVASR